MDPSKVGQKWEVYAVLMTGRGSKYNCGFISIPYSELAQMTRLKTFSFPLTKCLDPNAQVVLEVMKID